MSEYKFIFATVLFIAFMVWLESAMGVALVSANPNATAITIPNCNSTLDPLFFFCTLEWAGFILIGLPALNSAFLVINIFLSGLTMACLYIFLRLIRGGG